MSTPAELFTLAYETQRGAVYFSFSFMLLCQMWKNGLYSSCHHPVGWKNVAWSFDQMWVCVCLVSQNTPEGQAHQKCIKVHSGRHSPDQSLLDFIHWELIGWWKRQVKGKKKEGLITLADKESCFRGESKLLHFNERFKETFFAFGITCKVKSAQ